MQVYSTGYNHLRLVDITITEVTETRVKGVKADKSTSFDVKRYPENRFFLGSGSSKSKYFFTKG